MHSRGASVSRRRLGAVTRSSTLARPPSAASSADGSGPARAPGGAVRSAARISPATWSAMGPSTTCRSVAEGLTMPRAPSRLSAGSSILAPSATTSRRRVVQASTSARLPAPPSALMKAPALPPATSAIAGAGTGSSASRPRRVVHGQAGARKANHHHGEKTRHERSGGRVAGHKAIQVTRRTVIVPDDVPDEIVEDVMQSCDDQHAIENAVGEQTERSGAEYGPAHRVHALLDVRPGGADDRSKTHASEARCNRDEPATAEETEIT